MDLPDCPPGAEGYNDSVVEVPKKPEENCTKAEQEFADHLNSLKIKLENDEARPMVERRGRDVSGKWIYLCYPCAAVCSGESVLQTHISGKKHKTKLAMRNVWPLSIFEDHPYIKGEKGVKKDEGSEKIPDKLLQKMAEEVDLHNKPPSELDSEYNKYRNVRCHIQDSIDAIKAPLVGVEYLVEHPPEQAHYEPSYMCTLCNKQGHPRTIVNHMTCFWHRYNYLLRHFRKACLLLSPFRGQNKYREGVSVIMNRLAQRVEDTYGRMKPLHIDKEEYEKDKERIHQWIFKSHHFSENANQTFEEVVDVDLITSLHQSNEDLKAKLSKKEPSPPVVAAPSKPQRAARIERHPSLDALSDISDERPTTDRGNRRDNRSNNHDLAKSRYEPYPDKRRISPFKSRYAIRNQPEKAKPTDKDKQRAPNYEYKVKLAEEKRKQAEDSAKKTLAYHEKNPEKHPLYPEEWKKFWNRRYKEIQAEGKDPSKHDFKPEWILFWTARMKELHEEELRVNILEIYRKLCLSPPPNKTTRSPERNSKQRSPEVRRRSPDPRRRSPESGRRSVEARRRSPERRRRSPDSRRRSPEFRREFDRDRRRSMDRRSPERRPDYRRDRRSPEYRRSPPRRRSMERRHSPERRHSLERRHSPERRRSLDRRHSPARARNRSRSPVAKRSPARTKIVLESLRRSRSPLSCRGELPRNRSPAHTAHTAHPAPSLQTVMISDDELKPNDGLSPWNSDNDIESLGSLPEARSPIIRVRSRADSMVSSRASISRKVEYSRGADPQDLGPAENVVATLRLLVALEDYLGSLGPKIVNLLTEALKMEKEKANSSEELLERESAVVLIETAKEKLKGAAQAGLVPSAAATAVRTAVVRAAATLHEADTRAKKKQQSSAGKKSSETAAVPVAGVGAVDREQIARQIAAALIAQGKTNVSTEELQQLVDEVVGMAEAKKRQAEVKKKVEARAEADKQARPAPAKPISSTASALQMLQSAYDEHDKKVEKEDAPDAMDGLSDSDLETLLKNFSELSAEEQHSLIAYLKKLEAREPHRVERLRQYVSAAATSSAVAAAIDAEPEEAPKAKMPKTVVTIESDDDDDYTVEEIFRSAKEKVKENQIRQEMEVVKKSLETLKPAEQESAKPALKIDLSKNMSAATDLLALVQASIQSTSKTAPVSQTADVVMSNVQPRSFGDLPEQQANTDSKAVLQTPMNQMPTIKVNMPNKPGGFGSGPNQNPVNQHFQNDTRDYNNEPNNFQNDSRNFQDDQRQFQNDQGNYPNNQRNFQNDQRNFQNEPSNFQNEQRNFQTEPRNFQNEPRNLQSEPRNFQNEPRNLQSEPRNFQNEPRNLQNEQRNFQNEPRNLQNEQRNLQNEPRNFQNEPRNFQNNYQNEPRNFSNNVKISPWEQPRPPVMNDNRLMGAPPQRPFDNFNQGPPRGNFMNGQNNNPVLQAQFGNQPPQQQFGNQPPQQQFGNQPPQQQFGNQHPQQQFGNQPPQQQFGNKPPQQQFGNQPPQQQFGNQPPQQQFGNQPPQQQFGNQPQQQQFGNQGNNFRGRGGRGNFGGPMRGRGRGYY